MTPLPLRSQALADLRWPEVAAHLEHDRRLIVPVGELDQHGAHLPLGTTSRIAERLAVDLSREFGVLRAPIFPFGVNVRGARRYPGAAMLREKTLHRTLNDLVADWEHDGFDEFVLITAHAYDPHVEAVATVSVDHARVRVVEALGLDLSEFLDAPPGPQHAGEVVTSLMLHLAPETVDMNAASDFTLDASDFRPFARSDLPELPAGCLGAVGYPTLASPDKGRRIYEHVLERIRHKVFLAPEEADS
jgi:creatinine amidohydrolase